VDENDLIFLGCAMNVNVLCNLIVALPFPPDEIFVKLMTWAS